MLCAMLREVWRPKKRCKARFLSGMNPMISSRNCTFQSSSVNCRDQCVHQEYHCKIFQQVCPARSPTGDFMLSNNDLHAFASLVFASATCLSEKVYTIHAYMHICNSCMQFMYAIHVYVAYMHTCNSQTIDVLISNHRIYTQYTERSTHGLAHRGDCCEQNAPRIFGAIPYCFAVCAIPILL